MTVTSNRTDLFHDIETRQDQVLAELETLERQLEQLLAQFGDRDKAGKDTPA